MIRINANLKPGDLVILHDERPAYSDFGVKPGVPYLALTGPYRRTEPPRFSRGDAWKRETWFDVLTPDGRKRVDGYFWKVYMRRKRKK